MSLCAASIYRQIRMRYFPDDLIQPVIVYLIYLLLLSTWRGSIRNRITQMSMRTFLLLEHPLMLFGVTIRFLQDALLYRFPYLMRVSGYWYTIPFLMFPLFGLYAALGLGKTEEYKIGKKWYALLIPTGILSVLMLTAENNSIMVRRLEGEGANNLLFHPGIGSYIFIATLFLLIFARIFLIYSRSREATDYPRLRLLPFLIATLMLVFTIPYILASFYIGFELIEFAVLMYFMEILIWESCIMVGMVPVNTRYEEVFDRSTVAMQIIKEDGEPYLKSAGAPELAAETLDLLKQHAKVRTPEGQEYNLHTIRGGYAIWKNDVSQTLAVIDELRASADKLEQEGELLSNELKSRSDETSVQEQNIIYNNLTDEIGGQLLLLQNMLQRREQAADTVSLFRKICLIGTYIKRRCNLRLVEQSEGDVPLMEIELCYRELIGCLQELGVDAGVSWNGVKAFSPEFAVLSLDVCELLLENEQFEADSISVSFEEGAAFSVRVKPGAAPSGQFPIEPLRRLGGEGYDMGWQPLDGGYEVSVRAGGS